MSKPVQIEPLLLNVFEHCGRYDLCISRMMTGPQAQVLVPHFEDVEMYSKMKPHQCLTLSRAEAQELSDSLAEAGITPRESGNKI